jgi:hypothetical protein
MKKIFLSISLFCFGTLQAATPAPQIILPYQMQNYDSQIISLYKHLPANPKARFAQISGYFLGKPYILHPAGEGENAPFNEGPLYRTDAFDCTTYVEIVLALNKAQSLAGFQQQIKAIRYQNGEINFFQRNHFTSVDWNMNNAKKGYIHDITCAVDPQCKVAQVKIDKPNWYRHFAASDLKLLQILPAEQIQQRLEALHQHAKTVSTEYSRTPYIPMRQLFLVKDERLLPNETLFDRIPSNSLIEIVYNPYSQQDKIGTDLVVAHMGFVLRTAEGLVFRQASSVYKQVVDVPLAAYLAQHYPQTHAERVGINVQQVLF